MIALLVGLVLLLLLLPTVGLASTEAWCTTHAGICLKGEDFDDVATNFPTGWPARGTTSSGSTGSGLTWTALNDLGDDATAGPNTLSSTGTTVTSTSHGLSVGHYIRLTSGAQANQYREVTGVTDANTVTIDSAFSANQSGVTWSKIIQMTELVTTTPCGSRGKSLHQRIAGGTGAGWAGDQQLDFSPARTVVRVRFYMCLASNFSNFNASGREDYMHLLFFGHRAASTGTRLDMYPYGPRSGGGLQTLTYNSTTYKEQQANFSDLSCGNLTGQRGYVSVAVPQAGSTGAERWFPVGLTGSETKTEGDCLVISTLEGTWFPVEVAYEEISGSPSFTCSGYTCTGGNLAHATLIIDGTTYVNDQHFEPDDTDLTITSLAFSGFASTWVGSNGGQLDMYFDDIIVSSDYSTLIGPSGGSGPSASLVPSGGALVQFISQATVVLFGLFQYCMVLGYLWERRAKAMAALMLVHQWYWMLRYRRAIRRWQAQAPKMLDAPMTTVELPRHAWRHHGD